MCILISQIFLLYLTFWFLRSCSAPSWLSQSSRTRCWVRCYDCQHHHRHHRHHHHHTQRNDQHDGLCAQVYHNELLECWTGRALLHLVNPEPSSFAGVLMMIIPMMMMDTMMRRTAILAMLMVTMMRKIVHHKSTSFAGGPGCHHAHDDHDDHGDDDEIRIRMSLSISTMTIIPSHPGRICETPEVAILAAKCSTSVREALKRSLFSGIIP